MILYAVKHCGQKTVSGRLRGHKLRRWTADITSKHAWAKATLLYIKIDAKDKLLKDQKYCFKILMKK